MRRDEGRFKTRITLVIVGLALGFAARWIGDLLFHENSPPLFDSMPAAEVDVDAEKVDVDAEKDEAAE